MKPFRVCSGSNWSWNHSYDLASGRWLWVYRVLAFGLGLFVLCFIYRATSSQNESHGSHLQAQKVGRVRRVSTALDSSWFVPQDIRGRMLHAAIYVSRRRHPSSILLHCSIMLYTSTSVLNQRILPFRHLFQKARVTLTSTMAPLHKIAVAGVSGGRRCVDRLLQKGVHKVLSGLRCLEPQSWHFGTVTLLVHAFCGLGSTCFFPIAIHTLFQ